MVKARMVEGFQVLRQMPTTFGPKAYGSNWPRMLSEFADLVDPQVRENVRQEWARTRILPDMMEIARMEEAICWPARFLGDFPKGADALNLWALCKAGRRKIDPILEDRSEKARALAKIVERELNALRAAKREPAAFDASQWAKMRFRLSPRTAEAKDRIIANAVIRLERELAKKDLLHDVRVRAVDVSPNHVLSEGDLRDKRDLAAQLIADKLARR